MNLTAMRQKLADLKAKGDGILKAADGRELTDAERVDFDANMAAITTTQGDIKRLEAMADLERSAPTVPATGPRRLRSATTMLRIARSRASASS
jgi:hypothetical protein